MPFADSVSAVVKDVLSVESGSIVVAILGIAALLYVLDKIGVLERLK